MFWTNFRTIFFFVFFDHFWNKLFHLTISVGCEEIRGIDMKRYSNCLEEIHGNFVLHKGQIISEGNCGVINFPKKQRTYSKDFFSSL